MNLSLKLGVPLLLCVLTTSALADDNNGFGVATAARARDVYGFDTFVSAFRTAGDSSGNYTRPGDAPSVQGLGCQNIDPSALCVGSASGTGGANYNLTASSSAASRAWTAVNQRSTGTAFARANLATGELGVVASSDRFTASLSGFPTHNAGDAFAQMNDILWFTVAGATAQTVTYIGVDFTLNGSLSITDLRGGADVRSSLFFGTASTDFSASIGAGSATPDVTQRDTGWVSSNWVLNPAGSFQFSGVYALTGAAGLVGIYETLRAGAGGSGTAAFGSTAHLALRLPSNVSFTSNSGVFLTAVPEPGSWALMLAGLGCVLRLVSRREPLKA